MERFSRCSKDIKILDSDDQIGSQNIVKVVNTKKCWRSACGEMIVDSIKYPNVAYQWTLKINMRSVSIGIASIDDDIDNYDYLSWHDRYYGLAYDGLLEAYDTPSDTIYPIHNTFGDIIKMIYDTKNNTLSFSKNQTPIKIACEDVDISAKYRLVISTYCYPEDETIELTDFEISFV